MLVSMLQIGNTNVVPLKLNNSKRSRLRLRSTTSVQSSKRVVYENPVSELFL